LRICSVAAVVAAVHHVLNFDVSNPHDRTSSIYRSQALQSSAFKEQMGSSISYSCSTVEMA
jgi:hypothetical protein